MVGLFTLWCLGHVVLVPMINFSHSYLGKGFCGNQAMNKVLHMCFGRWFDR